MTSNITLGFILRKIEEIEKQIKELKKSIIYI